MVNTRALRRAQCRTQKSVATHARKTRSSVKPSPPVANLSSKATKRKVHGTGPPSLPRRRKSSPEIYSSSPSNSPSSVSANASPSTSLSYTAAEDESEDHDEYTSAAPSVSSSEDELDEANIKAAALPSRLFSTDRYPTEGRVNSYSRLQYLVDILSVLDGSIELRTLMQSPFSSLFELPVRRCLLSGKLVHNFLSRQLVTTNSDELWFTFGGYPLRFSLAEFEKVTGLPCGPYPDKETLAAAQEPSDPANAYWHQLIGPEKEITIEPIVEKLKNEPGMLGWRKLALSLIVIVEGVLICGTQPIRASFPIVEMVKDLKFFFSYPWGRHSFEHTIRMLKVGKQVTRKSVIVKKMKQHSLVLHGFPVAIQLMIFQSVPLLLRYLPFSDDFSTFYDRSLSVLPLLKTYHTHNILAVENDSELSVTHTVAISASGRKDSNFAALTCEPKVQHMIKLIEEGYTFCKVDWRGGDESLERLCICQKKNTRPCNCGSSLPTDDNAKPRVRRSHSGCSHSGASASAEIATLKAQIIRLEKKSESMALKLKSDLLSEMRGLFSSHKCPTCEPNSRRSEYVSPHRASTPTPPGLHTPPTPNIGNLFQSEENHANPPDYDPPNHQPSSEEEYDDVGHHYNHAFPVDNGGPVLFDETLPSEPVCHAGVDCLFQVSSTSGTSKSDTLPPVDPVSLRKCNSTPATEKAAEAVDSRPSLCPSKVHTVQPEHTAMGTGLGSERLFKAGVSTSSCKDGGFCHSVHVEPSVPVNSDRSDVSPSESLDRKVCGEKVEGSTPLALQLDYVVNSACRPPLPEHPQPCSVSTTSSVGSPSKRCRKEFVPPRIFTDPKPFKRPRRADREHIPFVDYDPCTIAAFKTLLRQYQEETYDIDGVNVSKSFFEDIYTPHKWLHRTHMDCIIRPFWTKRGAYLASIGIVVHDTLLTELLSAQYRTFGTPMKSSSYVWDSHLTSCVEGCVGDRIEVTKWFRDIHTIYAPMNWGNRHWVCLCISLKSCDVEILDPMMKSTSDEEVASYMEPFMKMLPLLIKETCHPSDITHLDFLEFCYERVEKLPQTTCPGDTGPFVIKLMEMHSHRFGVQGFGDMPDDWVEKFRMQYAIEAYQEFVCKV